MSTSNTIAKEITANFKMIMLALGASFVFLCIYYYANKPEYYSEKELKEIEIYIQSQKFEPFMFVGHIYRSKYDKDIPVSLLSNYNKIVKNNFHRDLQEKAKMSIISIIIGLIVIRYIVLLISWVNKNNN
jgi:hypothetical protein